METKAWKWFRYDQIFEIKKGKRLTKADMVDGDIPYIGATDSNNGITARVSNSEHLHSANTITVSYNGSIAEAYYQTKMFWATDDVNVLYPKFEMTPFSALFLTTIINKEKYRFNYGRKWDKELMQVSKIKLPIDKTENPDWQWIENYVQNTLIPKLPQKTKSVWQRNFDTTPLSPNKLQLKTKEWQWFTIDDGTKNSLFSVAAGKYHYPSEYSNGNTPYLSATAVNNGVGNKIDLDAEFEGNVVTTEKVGCTSFYQPKPFCATSDVNIITCKRHKINPYIGLFLASVIDFNENFRWTYGRQCRVGDTKAIRIKLPATKNAQGEYEPDWQWMEDYIKGLPYSGCL